MSEPFDPTHQPGGFPLAPPTAQPSAAPAGTSPAPQPGGPPTGGTNRTPVIIGVVALVVAVLAAVAVLTTRSSDKDSAASSTSEQGTSGAQPTSVSSTEAPTSTTGNGSTDRTPAESNPEKRVEVHAVMISGSKLPELNFSSGVMPPDRDNGTGKVVPTVSGVDINNQPSTIGKGTPGVYVFVAHWCPHCQREVPEIVKWEREGLVPEGVELVAIPTATESDQNNYPPSDWLIDERWPGRTLVDSAGSEAAKAYGLPGFPYFVAVDADGKVVRRGSGELSQSEFEEVVNSVAPN